MDDSSINLHITSSQTNMQGETDTIEFFTEAKYYEKGGRQYITYKESEISGFEGTNSTIRVNSDEVTLTRFGTINSRMVFKKGRETRAAYATAYGIFDLTIFTEKVNIDVCNSKLNSIYLKYTLKINLQEQFINEMNMRILSM